MAAKNHGWISPRKGQNIEKIGVKTSERHETGSQTSLATWVFD